MTLHIAVGGFLHESHSFAPRPTGWEEFVRPSGVPLRSGAALLDAVRDTSFGIAGAIAAAEAAGAVLVPLTWCFAGPAGPVTDAAVERIAALPTIVSGNRLPACGEDPAPWKGCAGSR